MVVPLKFYINTPKIPPSIFLDKVNTPKTDDPFFRIQGRTGTARLPPDRHAAAADEPQHGQAIRERVHTARYRLPSIRFHTYTRIFSLFYFFFTLVFHIKTLHYSTIDLFFFSSNRGS